MTIDLSPDEFRRLGYRAVDLLAEAMTSLPADPAKRPVLNDLRDVLLSQDLPETGRDPFELLERVNREVLPYSMGNPSPRFFAWVNSPPAPMGVVADLLASGLNSSVVPTDQSSVFVEMAVLGWLKSIMRFPADAGGVLVSGGSMANLTGLGVMRHVKTGGRIRSEGLLDQPRMTIYTSTQGHSCIQKATELLGFGSRSLRFVPVDSDFRMDVDALRAQILADIESDLRPVCVAASVGTVNSGAIDPLDAIADICDEFNLWLHVDGAYGGVGILIEELRAWYAGIERVDSVAIDPHKWLYAPVACGCALVRDAQAMRDAFSLIPPYLRSDSEIPAFSEFGFEQTRAFRALKLWLIFQQIGIEGYRASLTRDVQLAKGLRQRIEAHPDFQLVAAGPLSITCFRYAPAQVPEHQLDRLNRELVKAVQTDGRVYLSGTELNTQFVLRACIINFRTQESDLDMLLATLAEIGSKGRSP